MYLRLNFRWKSKASNLRQPKLFAFYKEKCSNNFSIRKCYLLKGYLRYKTITYQNVPSKADFFISQKNCVPFSRFSSFCIFNHPMIYQISVVTMSISTWDKAPRHPLCLSLQLFSPFIFCFFLDSFPLSALFVLFLRTPSLWWMVSFA